MTPQLVLPMGVDEAHDLDNFIDTPNRELVAYLKQKLLKRSSGHLEGFSAYLVHGEASAGKSHLLDALAQWVGRCSGEAVLLKSMVDLKRTIDWDHQNRVYLLDDLEGFCSEPDDERELMGFIERLKQNHASLVISAATAVPGLGIRLPDLRSRLLAIEGFELQPLGEAERREVVRTRARQRGIILSDEVLNWLFSHTDRELGIMLDLLERIDLLSLAEKRRVTIPLIKSLLADSA